MKKFLYLVLLAFFPLSLMAQNWAAQNSQASSRLQCIAMSSGSNGWAFGDFGELITTTNGGTNWNMRILSPHYEFHACWAFNDSTILAAGEHATEEGFVVKSTDGGQSWFRDSLTFAERINAVSFINDMEGWAVGRDGYMVKTTNGGLNWTSMNSGTTERLYSVFFVDAQTGWVGGKDGTLLKTTNGGMNWSSQASSSDDYEGLFFLDSQKGWACAGNAIYHTTNGGQNWTAQSTGVLSELLDIVFVNDTVGWAAGLGGTLIHTTDGGQNWGPQASATTNDIYSLSMLSPFQGWLSGDGGAISRLGGGAVTAAFSAQQEYCLGDTAWFSDLSQGQIQSWRWDFGDGNSATTANSSHVFSSAGQFIVSLVVDNGFGAQDTSLLRIQVFDLPQAVISVASDTIYLPQSSPRPFMSTGANATSWAWHFGNGDSATFQNPSATYNMPGIYTVRLIVTNGICPDTAYQTIVVIETTALDPARASFELSIFPQPMSDQSRLEVKGKAGLYYQFRLYDMNGKKLIQKDFPGSERLILTRNNLSQGMYIYEVFAENGEFVRGKFWIK